MKKKSEDYWRRKLSPEEYAILRGKGTEPPFSGQYLKNSKDGVYLCAACGSPLFSSDKKYDSHSGWPSFFDVVDQGKVDLRQDLSHGMRRVEVLCGECGSHLGHLFPDGPQPTGQRYCINSMSLKFSEKKNG